MLLLPLISSSSFVRRVHYITTDQCSCTSFIRHFIIFLMIACVCGVCDLGLHLHTMVPCDVLYIVPVNSFHSNQNPTRRKRHHTEEKVFLENRCGCKHTSKSRRVNIQTKEHMGHNRLYLVAIVHAQNKQTEHRPAQHTHIMVMDMLELLELMRRHQRDEMIRHFPLAIDSEGI